jgi:hypothetical protein
MMDNEVSINRMVMEVWDVLGLGRSLFARPATSIAVLGPTRSIFAR